MCVCIFLTAVCSSYFLFDGREIKPRAKKRLKTTLCCPFSLFCYARTKDSAEKLCYDARDITTIAIYSAFYFVFVV